MDIALFFILLGIGFFLIYNSLIRSKIDVKNAWAMIDVQLKRRYDLIPNLVETAKAYMKHERETLERIAQLRNISMNETSIGKKAKTEEEISENLKTIFAVVENYPELKAQRHFLELMEELKTTENRIAFARNNYNSAVADYNYRISAFPWIIVAFLMGLKKEEFFKAQEEEKELKVKV